MVDKGRVEDTHRIKTEVMTYITWYPRDEWTVNVSSMTRTGERERESGDVNGERR